MLVFHTVAEAIRAGFQVWDRTDRGFIVRMKAPAGYALALVDLTL